LLLLRVQRAPSSPLVPYTTLFRSAGLVEEVDHHLPPQGGELLHRAVKDLLARLGGVQDELDLLPGQLGQAEQILVPQAQRAASSLRFAAPFTSGRSRLRTTPTSAARAIPEKVTRPKPSSAPPIPMPSTTEAMMRFRLSPKSMPLSTRVRMPDEAMMPKRTRLMPPITGVGLVWRNAPSLGTKASRIAKTAARRITAVLYTRVMARTPTFSP